MGSCLPSQTHTMHCVTTTKQDVHGPVSPLALSTCLSNCLCTCCVQGFARLGGETVGIIANNPLVLAGVLDMDAAIKASRWGERELEEEDTGGCWGTAHLMV